MPSFRVLCAVAMAAAILAASLPADAADLPSASDLPVVTSFPDPLTMMDGTKVTSKEDWMTKRRPELQRLFQHYMYGYLPEATPIRTETHRVKQLFGGKATKKEVTIHYGPKGTPPIDLLVVTPNQKKPAPAFVAINFCGNHTALDDPSVALTRSWFRGSCPGCEGDKATEAGRGGQKDVWNVEMIIERGYGIAMFYYGDVDPDKNRPEDWTDGVHPHFMKAGQTTPGKHEWGAIAAWAYGIHRAVDYMVTDPAIDAKRIACVGHSRLGKTTLFATALDDRIALAIPHQAGCGGTAPNRENFGESVERINTSFPHWFNDTFPDFNNQVERLPFDQHCLFALCAPRPVLTSNAEEDGWADPKGQFKTLQLATPVYKLLGSEGLKADTYPANGELISSPLGYYIREGKHSMTTGDWKVFLDFADTHFQ